LADLALLEGDLTRIPPPESVLATVAGGKIVFEATR
jgi:hypothetical protein